MFDLPSSILQCVPPSPAGPSSSYKEAVEGFIRQQRLGETGGTSVPERQLQEKLAELSTRDVLGTEGLAGPGARPLAAAQTEGLIQLFECVKTLTAKEELLQTLR